MEPAIEDTIKANLDKTTNLLWIEPHVLAESDQNFLIYSPSSGSYLFMSRDPTISSKMHTKVEAHETRSFERNLFKLQKAEGDNMFYILNPETGKHVYVSGENVLGVEENPAGHPKVAKFQFLFEKYGDSGCFSIRNQDKFLHISKEKAGIPPCPMILADENVIDQSHIFQLVLGKNVKNAQIEYDTENWKSVVKLVQDLSYDFVNESEEEKPEQIEVAFPPKSKDLFLFQHGFQYSGMFLGGTPCRTAQSDGPSLVVFGKTMRNSTDGDDSSSGMACTNNTINVTVMPGHKMTVTFKIEERLTSVPFTIQVTTSGKKILKGGGIWTGGSCFNSSSICDSESLDGSDK